MASDEYAIQDGKVVLTAEAVIPAVSSAASYGDGCFETWRSYSGNLVATDRHIIRLKQSMKYLGMRDNGKITTEYVLEQAYKLLQHNRLQDIDARLRLQVWRLGPLGYKSKPTSSTSYLLTASPISDNDRSIRLTSVDIRRIPAYSLQSQYKTSNGLNYILARNEAEQRGFDDALLLDSKGNISETTIANIFWKRGQSVYTSSEHCDILPGITRGVLLGWIKQQSSLTLKIGEYTLEHLLGSETVWLTNSVQEVIPVSGIDDRKYDAGDEFIDKLRSAYREAIIHA